MALLPACTLSPGPLNLLQVHGANVYGPLDDGFAAGGSTGMPPSPNGTVGGVLTTHQQTALMVWWVVSSPHISNEQGAVAKSRA